LSERSNWRWRLVRFGEKLFGHNASRRAELPIHHHRRFSQGSEELKLRSLRDAEDARHEREMEKFIDAYDYSKAESRSSQVPSTLPSLNGHRSKNSNSHDLNRLSGHSLYSEVTGKPRQVAEPRQPIKRDLLASRFSSSTLSSSYSFRAQERDRVPTPPPPVPQPPTDAEAYAIAVKPALAASPPLKPGTYWIQPTNTGGSSRNPFRQ
jgi:hypothetical protein